MCFLTFFFQIPCVAVVHNNVELTLQLTVVWQHEVAFLILNVKLDMLMLV